MPIITYDQETNYLHNEDGEPVGKIFREGDGLGPLIEERVSGWLELSSEIGNLREQVRILREALEDNLQAWEGEEESVREEHADLIEETRAALEATKEP